MTRTGQTSATPYRPSALRWIACIALIILHWFAFESLTQWYIETYVTPRTGWYEVQPHPAYLITGPPMTVLLILLAFLILDRRIVPPAILLGAWLWVGALFAIWAGTNEYSRGREFWPDIVCIAEFFVFHALIVLALRTRSPEKASTIAAGPT